MARRQGRGRRRQVVRSEISRLSQQDVIDLFAQQQYLGSYQQVYTTGGRPTEKIPNSYAAFAETAYCSSSVVGAVMRVRRDIFRQARFTWREITEDGTGTLMHDDALAVLERPWPNGTTGELLTKMITDVDLCGNSFIANEEDRLRWRRPDWMYVVLSGDPNVDVDVDVIGYVYTPGGCDIRDGKPYLPEDICHWSPIPSWGAQYVGQSWMVSALKDIQADKAATDHKLSFFRNGATLGPIFVMPPSMTPEQFKKFRQANDEAHVGPENAYKPLYIGGGANVTMSSSTFQQLELKATQGAGESRIASLAGIHPAIAGLSEGLQGSSLNAGNFTAARRITSDITMMPLWQDACAALSTFVDVPDGYELWIRESMIPFLREDAKDAADIASINAQMITSLVREGYEPETAQRYAITRNPLDLKHSGLMSVQLQPPGAETIDGEVVEEVDFGALRSYPYDFEDVEDVERRYYGSIAGERVPVGHEGGGRFRKLTDQITDLLQKWAKGDGPDDPLDPLTDDQLRKVAKEKGLLAPRQRASRNALKVLLYKDAKGDGRDAPELDKAEDKPSPVKKAAKQAAPRAVTLSPRLAVIAEKLDEYVKSGTRAPSDLYHYMTSRKVGPGDARTLAKHFGVADRMEPGDDLPRLAYLIHGGGRSVDIDDELDQPKLSDDPDVRAVQVENKIREAYAALLAGRGNPTRSLDRWVPIADLRDEIGEDLTREEFDDALRQMATGTSSAVRESGFRLIPIANRKVLTDRDREAEIRLGGEKLNAVSFRDPSPRPLPEPKKAAKRTPDKPDLAKLRELDDPEALRDALDLKKVPELKAMLREEKLPLSGRKRELVDRLVEHIHGGTRGATADFDARLKKARKGRAAASAVQYRYTARGTDNADLFPDRAERQRISDAFASYRGIGHSRINKSLRGGGEPDGRVEVMDRAFAASTLTSDVALWRSVKRAEAVFGDSKDWPDDFAGFEWTDPAYVSTSHSAELAAVHGGGGRELGSTDVLVRILAPEGTPAVGLRAGTHEKPEAEVLLGRGLKFRVVRDHGSTMPDGLPDTGFTRVLDVEVIPAPKSAAKKDTRPFPSGGESMTEDQARARQADMDARRPAAEVLSDVHELVHNGASVKALKARITSASAVAGLSDEDRDRLVAAVDADVDNRIRAAYAAVQARKPVSDGFQTQWVGLAELRDELGEDLSRQEVDAALFRLATSLDREHDAHIIPESNQKTLTQADRDSAVVIGNQPKHFMSMDNPSPVPGLREATADLAKKAGLTQLGEPGAVVKFDRTKHSPLGKLNDGDDVLVMSPGYSMTLSNGETVTAMRPKVIEADAPKKPTKKAAKKAVPRTVTHTERELIAAVPVQMRGGALSVTPAGWSDQDIHDTQTAFTIYQGDMSSYINAHLRGEYIPDSNLEARARKRIPQLDRLFAESELPQDSELWRGVRNLWKALGTDQRKRKSLVGLEFAEPGYSSTSADTRVARKFASVGPPDTRAVFRIVAPKGTKGISLSDMVRSGHPGKYFLPEQEAEILLERGLKYRVVADHGVVDGVRRLDLEIVPGGQS